MLENIWLNNALTCGKLVGPFVLVWAARAFFRSTLRRDALWTMAAGLLGGVALTGAMLATDRLPYVFACIDCLEQYWQASLAYTFLDSFGWAGAATALSLMRRRRAAKG